MITEFFSATEDFDIEMCANRIENILFQEIASVGLFEELNPKVPSEKSEKVKRLRIRLNDVEQYVNGIKVNEGDISDDDYEIDVPCDPLTLPNSNTDRNAVEKLKSACNLCSYEAKCGWKQLTKHYVRKHPGKEISISRLSNSFNLADIMANPFEPVISSARGETMIQYLCYICSEIYNMSSSKWFMHFISHTGNERSRTLSDKTFAIFFQLFDKIHFSR